MGKSNDTEPVPEWVDDDPESALTMEMDDDELEFDDFSEQVEELAGAAEAAREQVPLWRLIEMSREDRSLRMELADFDQYDEFDATGDSSW